MSWYLVGPDKTGLDCSDCCAAFYESEGACSIRPCSIIGGQARRNYVCPSTSFPTDFHYYKRNPTTGDITIAPNPRRCSNVAPECATYSPSTGLNAGGRIGTGCSQTYVEATYGCTGSSSSCPTLNCNTACGYLPNPAGAIYYTSSCTTEPNATCSCVSSSSYSTCGCIQISASTEECVVICPYYRECNDGTIVCNLEDPCPCDDLPLPDPPCTACQEEFCTGEELVCRDRTCVPACSAGYTCSCGVCVCNTSSTCCPGIWGWSFDPENKRCFSCGDGYENYESSGCCDENYIRKRCQAGSICCNDGRCYSASTTLCTP